MVTATTELEMSPIVHLNGFASGSDTQELVRNNDSMNSFLSENNEITVTRWIDQRKFSMMSFKPCDKNVIDIVVTTGECNQGKQTLLLKQVCSQDIRSKYSTKARAAFGFIVLMLLIMISIIIVAMVTQPWNGNHDNDGKSGIPQEVFSQTINSTVENNVSSTAKNVPYS